MTLPSRQSGYTLLEVVVAFAILSVSTAALFESFSMALRRSERANNMARAALLIATLRDRLDQDLPLDHPEQSGKDDDCAWKARSTERHRAGTDPHARLRAYQVHLSAACGVDTATREATLDLLELSRGSDL